MCLDTFSIHETNHISSQARRNREGCLGLLGWGGGAGAPNNCQAVVYFLYHNVLNEKG